MEKVNNIEHNNTYTIYSTTYMLQVILIAIDPVGGGGCCCRRSKDMKVEIKCYFSYVTSGKCIICYNCITYIIQCIVYVLILVMLSAIIKLTYYFIRRRPYGRRYEQ